MYHYHCICQRVWLGYPCTWWVLSSRTSSNVQNWVLLVVLYASGLAMLVRKQSKLRTEPSPVVDAEKQVREAHNSLQSQRTVNPSYEAKAYAHAIWTAVWMSLMYINMYVQILPALLTCTPCCYGEVTWCRWDHGLQVLSDANSLVMISIHKTEEYSITQFEHASRISFTYHHAILFWYRVTLSFRSTPQQHIEFQSTIANVPDLPIVTVSAQ